MRNKMEILLETNKGDGVTMAGITSTAFLILETLLDIRDILDEVHSDRDEIRGVEPPEGAN